MTEQEFFVGLILVIFFMGGLGLGFVIWGKPE